MLRLVVTASGTGPIAASTRDIHGEVRKRHHGRPGDRAAGPDESSLIGLPDAAAAVPDRFDREAALRMEHLGKLGREEAFELLDRHDLGARHIHATSPARSLPSLRAGIGYNAAEPLIAKYRPSTGRSPLDRRAMSVQCRCRARTAAARFCCGKMSDDRHPHAQPAASPQQLCPRPCWPRSAGRFAPSPADRTVRARGAGRERTGFFGAATISRN